MVVSEIEAYLRGDGASQMTPGDVEFVHGGTNHSTEVEIRGRHYRITVDDIGPSGSANLKSMMGRLAGEPPEAS